MIQNVTNHQKPRTVNADGWLHASNQGGLCRNFPSRTSPISHLQVRFLLPHVGIWCFSRITKANSGNRAFRCRVTLSSLRSSRLVARYQVKGANKVSFGRDPLRNIIRSRPEPCARTPDPGRLSKDPAPPCQGPGQHVRGCPHCPAFGIVRFAASVTRSDLTRGSTWQKLPRQNELRYC